MKIDATNRLTESGRELLDRALRIALGEGSNYVNAEHIRKAAEVVPTYTTENP